MTEPKDDDFEEVPGSEDLPDDVRDGKIPDPETEEDG